MGMFTCRGCGDLCGWPSIEYPWDRQWCGDCEKINLHKLAELKERIDSIENALGDMAERPVLVIETEGYHRHYFSVDLHGTKQAEHPSAIDALLDSARNCSG